MSAGGDEWDQIEAEANAARAAGATPAGASTDPASGNVGPSAYAGGGFSLGDDPFGDDAGGGSLELDLPAHHQARSVQPPQATPSQQPPARPSGSMPATRPSGSMPATRPSSGSMPAARSIEPPPSFSQPPASMPSHGPPSQQPSFRPQEASMRPPQSLQPQYPSTSADPTALIARYPSPPTKLHETPRYAIKVLLRQFELREDLASLKKRRSPDVPLYERAIRTYDPKTFTLGLLVCGAIFVVACFLFCLPVILRAISD